MQTTVYEGGDYTQAEATMGYNSMSRNEILNMDDTEKQ